MLWIIVLIIVALIGFWGISICNNLISSREFVRNSMGNIAAQVESRWDAVSSLIDATKKYSAHEA
ncbi:MAG: LemA family protein, partial [Sedimentibacter sp.]